MLQKNRAQFVFTRFPFKTQSVVAPIQLGNLLMRLIVLNILPLFGRNSRVIHSHCFPLIDTEALLLSPQIIMYLRFNNRICIRSLIANKIS